MSWRDKLRPGSFRGVPFHATKRGGTAGRSYALHQYPNKAIGWAEDMGGYHAEEPLEVFVIGPDHLKLRDDLIAALNEEGPGVLVHPSVGSLRVQMGGCTWSESTKNGGMTTFQLRYVLAGEQAFPTSNIDSVGQINGAVNSGLTAAQNSFNSQFTLADLPGWLTDSASEWLTKGFDVLRPFSQAVASAASVGRTIDGIVDQIDLLMTTPDALADQLTGVMSEMFDDVSSIEAARSIGRALDDQFATDKSAEPIPTTTPARQQQSDNREAIIQLFSTTATLLTVRTIADQSQAIGVETNLHSPFDSYDQAIAIRDEQVAALDALAPSASDEVFLVIRDLQSALVSHIEAHGYRLERIGQYTPQVEMPALVLAHLLYGDATLADDIVRRNNIRHPGFVAAGQELEVLSA